MHPVIRGVTERIRQRSEPTRRRYEAQMQRQAALGRPRTHLACGNLAHVIAACPQSQKSTLMDMTRCNVAIVTAYNDMLSAHQPYADYPRQIKAAVAALGHSAQVAGGVPAMCDGVTQGQDGMDLSLFSRDVIAQATAVALSHNAFDAALLLGICDKIAPGQLMGALSFGHLPTAFVPAGPMSTGIGNDEKVQVRQQYAARQVGREALQAIENQAYHSPGTCTFYGTANTNQLVFEAMGLMLPGSAFVAPGDPLRQLLTRETASLITTQIAAGSRYRPLWRIVDERALVNGLVALLASGGSTNHTLHLVAVARAAGLQIGWDDFSDLSDVVPLLARVYPNGPADINAFQQAGGVPLLLKHLDDRGLLNRDAQAFCGEFSAHFRRPVVDNDKLCWQRLDDTRLPDVIAPAGQAFSDSGGLKLLSGNLGRAVIKVSAVAPEHRVVEAPALVFDSQHEVEAAYKNGELQRDAVIVVRYSGPAANGMPELHKLMPILGNVQKAGYKVALVTDGRLSGASGKIPAALHVTPEAAKGGALARLRTGDRLLVDALAGRLEVLDDIGRRAAEKPDLQEQHRGMGRELFSLFRRNVSTAEQGATVLFPDDDEQQEVAVR
ncbi:phosphogluconate dehydratase [Brenneria corticis]|uniref:Phosphogluconate dehydratase n=1 Tax=Brenneria corticis TaxID=2173106 RepID=A0A2U1U6T4_9GAMM|nr:phosphogluconate dehydratase [Brenneria sp. CFCC 11842]PWC17376.1 phosphogluconate dehydratase [Brenneria sp. CFCC 11842]